MKVDTLPVGTLGGHAGDLPGLVPQKFFCCGAVEVGHSLLECVVPEQGVELAAYHLPGLGGGVGVVLEEVERLRAVPCRAHELNAVLGDDEARVVHAVRNPETVQGVPAVGDHGLAHVVAREGLLLEKGDPAAVLGKDGRGRGPCGSGADDQDVEIGGVVVHGWVAPGTDSWPEPQVRGSAGGRISTT